MYICQRPLLEYSLYSTPVWSSYNYLVHKIKKGQSHFTKCLTGLNKISNSDRLQVLVFHSLERRRLNYDLILVYKILDGLTDINLSNGF